MTRRNSVSPSILILGPIPPPYGGMEVMTRTLVDGLSQEDKLSIYHLDTSASRTLAEKTSNKKIKKVFRSIPKLFRLFFMVGSFRPDIVYFPLMSAPSFTNFFRDLLVIMIAATFHVKVAVRLHGGHYFYAHVDGIKHTIVRLALKKVDLAMVQGQNLKSVFSDLIPKERIVVVPNGIADKPFRSAAQNVSKPVSLRNTKDILFIGLLCPEKGVLDILKAVPLVPPDNRFIFAGEWVSQEFREDIYRLIEKSRIGDRVLFPGIVSGPAKYELFLSSDIFVFPSWFPYEGHTVSTVEALAAGLPIVCTDHGALNESVIDGWNGYFVPKSHPQSVAERLNGLIRDESLRRAMASRSRQLYEERFTIEKFIERWTRAILEVALGKRDAQRT